jgi:putative lipoic acid-binding regulatory protein
LDNETAFEFPCAYPIKAIGHYADDFADIVLEIVQRHAPDLDANTLQKRLSNGGRYLSVTLTFTAQSREHLDAIYAELKGHERVLYLI